ncbi:MAG: ribulose-phosphate 3-epimerase [Gammaproteobacteria bacterium RIFCSPHIGHO2_12_FULL_37_14]|nr:MAG: ribulose-phosphate 3-epimerase [Gammaproteobacteria bacterium RIFCSPHIGHO2_12_FULL_37_14]
MQKYIIAPSLLSANFAKLGEEAMAVIKAGADMLHLDVMDNHYVPNLTVGPLVCEALRKYGITAPIDVHLMTKPVDRLIIDFANAGATHITFHPEASEHVDRSLALIHKHGCKAGLALNPATTLHCLEYVIDKIDILLLMSVNPGFGGQTFIPAVLEKVKSAREFIHTKKPDIHLAIDGGINTKNIAHIAKAGATMFIAGSAIFNEPDYSIVLSAMRKELQS